MAHDDSLPTIKLLLIGPSGAGKSALLTRYCEHVFEPESATATIGIDYKVKLLSVRGQAYRVTLFDTAGQARLRTLSASHYRGAHGTLLVYDVTSRASFAAATATWLAEAEAAAHLAAGAALLLVGAKADRADRAVAAAEGAALAAAHGARFAEASARSGAGVRRLFGEVVDMVVARRGGGGGGGGGAGEGRRVLRVGGPAAPAAAAAGGGGGCAC